MKNELTFEKKTAKGYFVYTGKVTTTRTIEVLKTVNKKKQWVSEAQSSEQTLKVYAPFEAEAIKITDEQLKTMRPMTKDNVAIPNFYWY